MGFDVADLLENLFGGGPAMATAATVASPDDDGGRFADWVRRPDSHGRMGWEAPDLPQVIPFDDLPVPGPACPRCGSLEQWQDALGRQRCGVCERGILDKALQLAATAARLRTKQECSVF